MLRQIFAVSMILFSLQAQAADRCEVRVEYDSADWKCPGWQTHKAQIFAQLRAKGYLPFEEEGRWSMYTLSLKRWSEPGGSRSEPHSFGAASLRAWASGHEIPLTNGNSQEDFRLGDDTTAIQMVENSIANLPSCEDAGAVVSEESASSIGGLIPSDAAHD